MACEETTTRPGPLEFPFPGRTVVYVPVTRQEPSTVSTTRFVLAPRSLWADVNQPHSSDARHRRSPGSSDAVSGRTPRWSRRAGRGVRRRRPSCLSHLVVRSLRSQRLASSNRWTSSVSWDDVSARLALAWHAARSTTAYPACPGNGGYRRAVPCTTRGRSVPPGLPQSGPRGWLAPNPATLALLIVEVVTSGTRFEIRA